MAKRECTGEDVIHLGPQVAEDGSRVGVRHTKNHEIQTGILTPIKDGQPLGQGVSCLSLSRREDGAFSVDELYDSRSPATESTPGPAMVNSEQYKKGWDLVFGKATVGVA
jgi:hypothetical protein